MPEQDRGLDIRIAPSAEPRIRVGGDVAAYGPALRVAQIGQVAAARAEPTHIKARPVARRVTLHAMRDRPREIGAISDLVARVRFGHMADDRAIGGRQRHLVLRAGDRMAHRLEALQINRNRLGVAVRQLAIEFDRHRGTDHGPVGTLAVAQRVDDLPDAPITDPGLPMGCDVGADDMSGPDIEIAAAGQLQTGYRLAGGVMRRMAISAWSESVDQISAALAIGMRHARCGGSAEYRGDPTARP